LPRVLTDLSESSSSGSTLPGADCCKFLSEKHTQQEINSEADTFLPRLARYGCSSISRVLREYTMTLSAIPRGRHRRFRPAPGDGNAFFSDTKLTAALGARNNFLLFCQLRLVQTGYFNESVQDWPSISEAETGKRTERHRGL